MNNSFSKAALICCQVLVTLFTFISILFLSALMWRKGQGNHHVAEMLRGGILWSVLVSISASFIGMVACIFAETAEDHPDTFRSRWIGFALMSALSGLSLFLSIA